MRKQTLILTLYALLLFAGGVMGYVIAHSFISLIVSSVIAIVLLGCSALILKRNREAYYIATFITAALCAFFIYRFLLTYKMAPGGIMALVSGVLFIYLIFQRKKAFQRSRY